MTPRSHPDPDALAREVLAVMLGDETTPLFDSELLAMIDEEKLETLVGEVMGPEEDGAGPPVVNEKPI